jgi:hypothetical protein
MRRQYLPLLFVLMLPAGCGTVTIDVAESGGENRIAPSDIALIAIDRASVAKPFPFFSGTSKTPEKGGRASRR